MSTIKTAWQIFKFVVYVTLALGFAYSVGVQMATTNF